MALEHAAEYCGLPLIYEFHNALHDALYAALVTAWMTKDAIVAVAPKQLGTSRHRRRSVKFSRVEYPKQPRQRLQPLLTREQVLNSREARFVPCPLCHAPGAVEEWYPQDSVYYGTFRCEEHGRFPVRMSVTLRADGTWQGRRVVPTLTEPERSAFAAARENEPFRCRHEKTKRKNAAAARKRNEKTSTPPSAECRWGRFYAVEAGVDLGDPYSEAVLSRASLKKAGCGERIRGGDTQVSQPACHAAG